MTPIPLNPTAINGSGEIIRMSDSKGGSFTYQNGTLTQLPTLGGTQNVALAINAQGQIVGNSSLLRRAGPGFTRPARVSL